VNEIVAATKRFGGRVGEVPRGKPALRVNRGDGDAPDAEFLGPKLRYQSMTDDFHLPIRKLPMTREGYIALQKDLAHRAQVERPRIAERIRDANRGRRFRSSRRLQPAKVGNIRCNLRR
jgi:hypothetical protein